MSDKLQLQDIFFYGLFMDERVLKERGVHPQASRKAVVKGYRLRIGERAMLLPEPSSKVFGMVHALTEREVNSLYAEPGLDLYRPETVVATFEDGSHTTVTTFNLQPTSSEESFNAQYAAKLRSVLERLGFPVTF
jgi:gamma-glutamyl AIG2-like cyclotransferase